MNFIFADCSITTTTKLNLWVMMKSDFDAVKQNLFINNVLKFIKKSAS